MSEGWVAGPESSEQHETPYVETEALLAVMNGDWERAEELVGGMHLGELRKFDDQVLGLRELIGRIKFGKSLAAAKAAREHAASLT